MERYPLEWVQFKDNRGEHFFIQQFTLPTDFTPPDFDNGRIKSKPKNHLTCLRPKNKK